MRIFSLKEFLVLKVMPTLTDDDSWLSYVPDQLGLKHLLWLRIYAIGLNPLTTFCPVNVIISSNPCFAAKVNLNEQ